MLLAGRTLVSIAWPEGYLGRYYWQHCYWEDNADFSSDGQMALQTLNNMKLLYTSQVQLHGSTWYLPGTQTVHLRQNYITPQFGSQAVQADYDILMCARWRMRAADGSYSYHLHRQPIGTAYLGEGGFNALGLAQNQIRANTWRGFNKYRSATGSLIASVTVATIPVQWQLRHGTKRRQSRGWL